MLPVAVLSCASVDHLSGGVKLLSEVSGNNSLAPLLEKFLAGKTSIQSLDGIDASKPLGAVIASDGLRIVPMAMLPLTDCEKFLLAIAPAVGEVTPVRDGVWKIGRRDLTGYMRQQGAWLFISQTEENLAWTPDPPKILAQPRIGAQGADYDASLQFNLQRIPEEFRTMAIDMLRIAMRQSLARRDGETKAAHELRHKLTSWQFLSIEQLLSESGQITLGARLDRETRQAQIDLFVQPLPGSKLATRVETLKQAAPRCMIGGDDAFLRGHATLSLNAEQRSRVREELGQTAPIIDALLAESDWLTADEDRKVLQGLASTLFEAAQATVDTGRLDVGFALSGSKPPITAIAAVHLGAGAPLEKMFERLSQLARQNQKFAAFQLDAARIGDHRVHAVMLHNGAAATLQKLLGDDPKLFVVFARDAMWLAAGTEALPALEKCFAAPAGDVVASAPIELQVHLRSLLEVSTATLESGTLTAGLTLVKGQLRQSDDRVRLSVSADDSRLHLQLVGHEGTLRLGAFGLGLQLLLGN